MMPCVLGCGREGIPEGDYDFFACPVCLDLLAAKLDEVAREADLQERRN